MGADKVDAHHNQVGHHDDGKTYQVRDYKVYKIENCPELVAAEKFLASKGLKDPWLRNEVWRHDPQFSGPMRTPVQRWTDMFFRGFKYGLAATVVVVSIETLFLNKPKPEHGHGHH